MPKPTPAAALAARLLQELAACAEASGGTYPIQLDQLATRIDPPPDPTSVLKSVANKAFTARAVVAVKGRADSPVGLLNALDALADSPLTLEAALRAKGAAGPAPWTPAVLSKAVAKPLQSRFVETLTARLAAGDLPPFAVAVPVKKALGVHHRDQPPPPPPPSQAAQDAVLLLRHVSSTGGPLLTLGELAKSAGLTDARAKKAVKEPAFAAAATILPYGAASTVIVPTGWFGTPDCAAALVAKVLTDFPNARATGFTAATLAAHFKKPFDKLLAAQMNEDPLLPYLSADVGFVLVPKGKLDTERLFFRLDAVQAGRPVTPVPAPAPYPAPPPADFPAAFDAAFERIDRQRGSNNFVSLVDLRAALPTVPREAFDAELHRLRTARRYVLTSDERYDGLTPEQQAAAIREEGEFLLHVSRGRS